MQRDDGPLMPAATALKVLIVDDMQSMRMLIRGGLQQLGFRDFEDAIDGENALRALVANRADLVISDYHMPVLDGIGLLRAVRAYPPITKTAFIMLTGMGDKDVVRRAVHYGVDGFLILPFSLSALKDKIEAVFGPLT